MKITWIFGKMEKIEKNRWYWIDLKTNIPNYFAWSLVLNWIMLFEYRTTDVRLNSETIVTASYFARIIRYIVFVHVSTCNCFVYVCAHVPLRELLICSIFDSLQICAKWTWLEDNFSFFRKYSTIFMENGSKPSKHVFEENYHLLMMHPFISSYIQSITIELHSNRLRW